MFILQNCEITPLLSEGHGDKDSVSKFKQKNPVESVIVSVENSSVKLFLNESVLWLWTDMQEWAVEDRCKTRFNVTNCPLIVKKRWNIRPGVPNMSSTGACKNLHSYHDVANFSSVGIQRSKLNLFSGISCTTTVMNLLGVCQGNRYAKDAAILHSVAPVVYGCALLDWSAKFCLIRFFHDGRNWQYGLIRKQPVPTMMLWFAA